VFYPFMRAHSTSGSPDKEPWAFDYNHEIVNRHAIELRYELLPYIYNVMEQASETGLPALRPLFLEFPDDENTAGIDDEFLFGGDLLVAPVLEEGIQEREVYLPKGGWFDYWTGHAFTGGRSVHVPVTLDSIPMFVREGGFIFQQPVVQSTGAMPGNPLRVMIAPANKSESALYEDDGESLDYRQGIFMRRRFRQTCDEHSVTIEVSAPEGAYRPARRDLMLEIWTTDKPNSVSLQIGDETAAGNSLPHLDTKALEKALRGWSFANGLLTVKDNDSFKSMRFVIER
jgi:alpha-glucosidase